MITEAIDHLEKQAVKAAGVRQHRIDGDPDVVLIEHNGTLIERPIPPPAVKRHVKSVLDFVAAWSEMFLESETSEEFEAAVWFDATRITTFLDEPNRRSQIYLPLERSWHFKQVLELKDGKTFDQQQLVDFLRSIKAVMLDPRLIEVFGTINWEAREASRVSTSNALRSIDADLVQQAKSGRDGAYELPTEIGLNVAPYFTEPLNFQVVPLLLDVETYPHHKKFKVQISPASYEDAQRMMVRFVRSELQTHLGEKGIPILFGSGDEK